MSEGTERDEGHKERRAQTAFDGANGANRWEEVVEQWLQTNMVYTGYVMEKNTSFSFFSFPEFSTFCHQFTKMECGAKVTSKKPVLGDLN